MTLSRRMLHEVDRLESALKVLMAISDPKFPDDVDQVFYRAEHPIALEDAEGALKTLRALAGLQALREAGDDFDVVRTVAWPGAR